MIVNTNIQAAWLAILMGMIGGAIQGLFFHDENWLGGYGSWTRRLMRLGHISFFGLALLNLAFAFTVQQLQMKEPEISWTSLLMLIGLVSMPLVCYLSAFQKKCRHLFIIPVGSLVSAVAIFVYQIFV